MIRISRLVLFFAVAAASMNAAIITSSGAQTQTFTPVLTYQLTTNNGGNPNGNGFWSGSAYLVSPYTTISTTHTLTLANPFTGGETISAASISMTLLNLLTTSPAF